MSLRTPNYRRHKSTGQAVVTINGRDFYLGKYNTAASREQYRRLVAEWLQTGETSAADGPLETVVAEVIVAYCRFARTYYRKNGSTTREYALVAEACRHVRRLYGRSPATDFGPLALKAVRQSMIDAGWSRKYINKQIERVRRMFKWAAEEELVPASIPQALSMVAGLRKGRTEARETAPVLPVDDGVVDATLNHLPQVVADMVRLQRCTGMRPGEVLLMRPCDIDRAEYVWQYRPSSHKTEHHDRERVVFLGPTAQGVLLRYLVRDVSAYCFQPRDSEAKRRAAIHADRKTPASCGNRPGTNRRQLPKCRPGDRYSADSYRRAIHRACDKAGVDRWSPNRLRHNAATTIRKEFGLEAAQVILGHSQANITQVYAERDLQKGVEVAKRIG